MESSRGLSRLGLDHDGVFSNDPAKLGIGVPSVRRKYGINDMGKTVCPRLQVRSSWGRGFGLFTLDDIPAYSQVLSEDALLSLGPGEDLPQLWEKYCALPSEDQAAFDNLSFPTSSGNKERVLISKLLKLGYTHDIAQKMARVSSRYHANAFGTENKGSEAAQTWRNCVFPKIARINHSCAQNVITSYRHCGIQVVYALRDIQAGEELEIAYFRPTLPYSLRQARAESWGFSCSCQVCSRARIQEDSPYERDLSLVRLYEEGLGSLASDHREQIEGCERAISIALSSDYRWLRATLPRLYLALWSLEIKAAGNVGTASEDHKAYVQSILEKSIEWEEKTTGGDSPSSMRQREALSGFNRTAKTSSSSAA